MCVLSDITDHMMQLVIGLVAKDQFFCQAFRFSDFDGLPAKFLTNLPCSYCTVASSKDRVNLSVEITLFSPPKR